MKKIIISIFLCLVLGTSTFAQTTSGCSEESDPMIPSILEFILSGVLEESSCDWSSDQINQWIGFELWDA